MNVRELKDLVEFLIEKDVSEFELERGDLKMRMKRAQSSVAPVPACAPAVVPAAAPVSVPATTAAAASTPAIAEAPSEETGLHIVRSPIVGTFYASPSPGAALFVQVGDTVQNGQVLCIVEAMKLMNEVESDMAGTIVKRYLENGQPVEYGQPLFALRVSS
jgi:acetyl-CoA carboxylase biotin carboxyl carrier protein